MISRRAPDTRIILVLVVLAFLAVMAWRWSLRAGRVDSNTAPTPGSVPAMQSSAGSGTP